MSEAWKSMKQIPQEELQNKLQTVKELNPDENEHELYEIVKHVDSGAHYLHYAYVHLHVSDGSEEAFHQLLPLETDDVLGIIVGGEPYRYPDHWGRPFLRNGPDGTYVWFDPADLLDEEAEREQKAGDVAALLAEWKKAGKYDKQAVKELFERIDQVMDDNN